MYSNNRTPLARSSLRNYSFFTLTTLLLIFSSVHVFAESTSTGGGGVIETNDASIETPPISESPLLTTQSAVPPSDLNPFATISLNGDYIATGVGLRGHTSGAITLSGLPAGASLQKAYLYWSFLDDSLLPSEQNITFNGTPIVGTEIGSGEDTCWGRTYSRAFRADVTSLVTGNGTYVLSNVANVSPLLAQGASLVVVYEDKNATPHTIVIRDGDGVINNGNTHLLTILDGFTARDPGSGVSAKTTFIVGDGQPYTDDLSLSGTHGTFSASNAFDGSDGELWDTDTYNVSSYVAAGESSVVADMSRGTDCLNWVAQVFSVTTQLPKTIVVDPGHGRYTTEGGVEMYARDPNIFGVIEDVVVLQIGNKVREDLSQMGFRVLFSRSANSNSDPDRDPFRKPGKGGCDNFCSTKQRAEWADRSRASAFVSIHTNAGSLKEDGLCQTTECKKIHGTETFYDGACSGKPQQSRTLGQKILDRQLALGLEGHGGIIIKDANVVGYGKSNVLCIKKMPSALTEVAFHSNVILGLHQTLKEDLDGYKLGTQDFISAVAEAIANAVSDYYASL